MTRKNKEAVIEQARKVRLASTGPNINEQDHISKVFKEVDILNQKLDALDESEGFDKTMPAEVSK